MAKQSKRAKYHAQTKRENSLLKRALAASQQGQGRATALVLGALVQNGGDLVFSQQTTDTMNKELPRMGYKIEPTPEGLVRIILVMQEPESLDPPADTMTQGADGKIILTD